MSTRARYAIAAAYVFLAVRPARAQNRGVYPLGMTALNAGALPDSGTTYGNQLILYHRNRAKDDAGNTLPVRGNHSVVMDLNTFTWVSRWSAKGFHYAAAATLPIAWNDLTSDVNGPINQGRGFADSFYLPLILGRNGERSAVRVQYGFLAPTGKFTAGGTGNVGSGYWTHTLSSGQTLRLTRDRKLTLSAFEMWELHTEQLNTGIRPGDTFDLDASAMGQVAGGEHVRLELGAVGYAMRQLTQRTGAGVPPATIGDRYAVNALGVAMSVVFPKRRANLALKYFDEFRNRSTFEGYSLQLAGAIAL